MIHPEAIELVRAAEAAGRPKLRDIPPEIAREIVMLSIKAMDAPIEDVADVREFAVPGYTPSTRVRLYTPATQTFGYVLLFFHGGGWVLGNVESHDQLCRSLANALELRVVSLDYRLAPEHPFPAAYDDAMATAEWIAASPSLFGAVVPGVILCGDSAGGNLAAAVAANWRQETPLRAQLLLYPVLDISSRPASYDIFGKGLLLEAEDMEFFINAYAPDPSVHRDPRLSPLHASVTSVPPTVIVTAGADVLRDEGRAYAASLISSGIETHFFEAAGFLHGWATARGALPSVNLLFRQILTCLRTTLLSTE